MSLHRLQFVLCFVLMLALLLPPKTVYAQQTAYVDRAGGPRQRMTVELRADSAPMPGGVVGLTLTATPLLAAPDVQVEWLLPDGVELLEGGGAESLGSMAAHQTAVSARRLRFPAPGVYKVMANAGYSTGGETYFSALGVLFFTVSESGATVSDRDPAATSPQGTVMPAAVTQDVTAASVRAANGDPCFNVSGVVTRQDLPPIQFTSGGSVFPSYGPAVSVPVRHVKVEMREEDTFFDDTYGTAYTNEDGTYAFSFCDDDGVFDDELEIYVEITAEIDSNGSDVVSVEDDGIIDDVYTYHTPVIESEGGTYNINPALDMNQSAVMNIADAVYEAWLFWNNSGGAKGADAIFDGEAEVHYEPGEGETGSYYNGYFLVGSNVLNNDDITIADDPSNPDPWDDSVIMHEWGHMADDYYGCDDNAGGPHNVDTLVSDPELSWGEGYPDYWQSAVRSATGHVDASWYLDVNGTGNRGIAVNLETYDSTRVNAGNGGLLTDRNELAIAAMLWDLNDSANEARVDGGGAAVGPWDRSSYGHATLQEIYTDPVFESNGDLFDDACTSYVYLQSWKALNKPADKATAETVSKNIGNNHPFGNGALTAATASTVGAVRVAPPTVDDARWWDQLTMVVDNSASMDASGKLASVKTLMTDQVNRIVEPSSRGVETSLYTFNNTSFTPQLVTRGQFSAEGLAPRINALGTTAAADGGCQVDAFNTLFQAIADKRRGQAWLYTDGDSYQSPGVPALRTQLNSRLIRASFALLGGCGSPARPNSQVSGDEESYLVLAADGSQPSGIVPYMLAALGSGGQFLYVDPAQLGDAADVLRAQYANTAGAGRWSDYVSDSFTYRWDRLTSREYQWFPAESLGQGMGQLYENQYVTYNLPEPFPFYGSSFTSVGVSENGFVELDPCSGVTCPIIQLQRYFLDILNGALQWGYKAPGPRAAAVPEQTGAGNPACDALYSSQLPDGPLVCVYAGNLGFEWHIISFQGLTSNNAYRGFQIWLNTDTGEIRYLYDQVTDEAAGAEIGLRRRRLGLGGDPVVDKMLVSDHLLSGASSDMGYKFTPAPPQPTRTYTVKVDPLIDSVAFLQTGYSGDFETMVVTDPDGNPVDCNDTARVLCVTMDHNPGDRLVQLVQVDIQGRVGEWHATVDAGAGGQGTYSFNALAASSLTAESPSDHLLGSIGTSSLRLQLPRAVDGGQLTGWFQKPNGDVWGSQFILFDDGQHGDGRAGDGLFGLPDLTPPGRGVGYLWVSGAADGVEFRRSDPVPFNFQPVRVTILGEDELPADTGDVALQVQIENLDSSELCFDASVELPVGWGYDWDFDELGCFGLAAGASALQTLTLFPAWSDAPGGTRGEVTVAFAETEEGAVSDSDQVTLIRHRPPFVVEIDRRIAAGYLRPNGTDAIPITVDVVDEHGYPVADGTLVDISATAGTVSAEAGAVQAAGARLVFATRYGRVSALYTAPVAPGDVVLTANVAGIADQVVLHIMEPQANRLRLDSLPPDLSETGKSLLAVEVSDPWGAPVANALVRIGVADDEGSRATIDGGEFANQVTDEQGLANAFLTRAAGASGPLAVTAQLLAEDGSVLLEETIYVQLGETNGGQAGRVYLPFVRR